MTGQLGSRPSDPSPPGGTRRKVVESVIAITLIVFVVAMILQRASKSYDSLEGDGIALGLGPFAALVLFVLAVPVSGVLWGVLISELANKKIGQFTAIRSHIGAWLLKYVPGQLGAVAWKLRWGSQRGLSRSTVSLGFLYENLFLGVSSTVATIPIIVLGIGIGEGDSSMWLLLGVAVAAGFALLSWPPVLGVVIEAVAKIARRGRDESAMELLSGTRTLRLQIAYLLPRLMNGAGFALLVASIHDVTGVELLVAGAAYVLAGILGILAFFVPSGIGVREAVIVVILAPFMPTPVAVVIAVNARIYATVADGVLALAFAAMGRKDRTP